MLVIFSTAMLVYFQISQISISVAFLHSPISTFLGIRHHNGPEEFPDSLQMLIIASILAFSEKYLYFGKPFMENTLNLLPTAAAM